MGPGDNDKSFGQTVGGHSTSLPPPGAGKDLLQLLRFKEEGAHSGNDSLTAQKGKDIEILTACFFLGFGV